MNNMPFKRLSVILSAAILALYLGQGQGQAQSAGDTLKQVQATPELTAQGKTLFDANCVSCHGAQGKGDGLAAAALNPKPRNFHAAEGWKNGREFAGMYKTLEEGLAGTPMGAYNHLSAKDRVSIITYIRSLATSNYPAITAAEIEKLEADYDFSKKLADDKKIVPIPVSVAIEKLIAEAQGENDKVAKAVKRAGHDASTGALLYQTYVKNGDYAFTSLLRAGNGWRSNLPEFVKLLSTHAGANGFSNQIGSLEQGQWQTLQNYLKSLI